MRWPLAGSRRRSLVVLGLIVLAVGGVAVILLLVVPGLGQTAPQPVSPGGIPSGGPAQDAGRAAGCPNPTVTVGTASALQDALATAGPGTVILLAPGVYHGSFTARKDGTATQPITVCGTADSILDGDGVNTGYVFHLDRVSNWVLTGFSLRNGQKGVMADGTVNSVIRGLTVSDIGDEGIHLRRFSTGNEVVGNVVRRTGLRTPAYGEGIYIGSAESNWCSLTGCLPDRSDRNTVVGNVISATTAESIDVKEGTTGGVLRDNTFEGSAIVKADSWVDIKGNDWLIEGNTGTNSPQDGFQTHEILDGWGRNNVFRNNTATVNGPGYGYALTPALGNVLECSNAASAAARGPSNVPCSG